MPPIRATVSWPAGSSQPIVTPDPITVPAANGATVINWQCDDSISALSISGLDAGVFRPSASNGMVRTFSTTDANQDTKLYSYNVGATRAGGATAEDDPKIRNGA